MTPFKLHAVLKIRQQAEDKARQALYSALQKEENAKTALQEKEQELDELYLFMEQSFSQGTSATEIERMENWIAVVREQITSAKEVVSKAHKQTELKRRGLLKASKDRKIMEKMKEQQNEAYKQFLNKKERAMLDELAVLYHNSSER